METKEKASPRTEGQKTASRTNGQESQIDRIQRERKPNVTLDQDGIRRENLQKLKVSRGRCLANLTMKRKAIEELIQDALNIHSVRAELTKLQDSYQKFDEAHEAYHSQLREDEEEKSLSTGYMIKVERDMVEFIDKINAWMTETESRFLQDGVQPCDSASQAGSTRKSNRGSMVSEARAKELAKLAALQAKSATLKQWHLLQEEELKLKMRREELKLEMELAAARAVEEAYAELEIRSKVSRVSFKPRAKEVQQDIDFDWKPHGPRQVTVPRDEGRPSEKVRSILKEKPHRAHPVDYNTNENFPISKSTLEQDLSTDVKSTRDEQNTSSSQILHPALHESTCMILDRQNKIMEQIVCQQQGVNLPQRQMPMFGGDPLQYRTFIKAFETLIENKEPDESARLYYLEQYTIGRVKELVKSCQHMTPREGYRKARELLEQRFGQRHKIAMAYVEKVVAGPLIRADDGNALEDFSISLSSCKNSLEAMGYLTKIENPDCMRKIIERLPHKLQDRWRDIADYIINVQGREVTIEDIADFVEQKARSLNNPIFGKTAADPRQRTEARSRSVGYRPDVTSKRTVFAASTEQKLQITPEDPKAVAAAPVKRTCLICEKPHLIDECKEFREKSVKERLELVMKKRLCFSCLRWGHQSKGCRKRKPCDKCDKRHATLLHPLDVERKQVPEPKDATVQDTQSTCKTNAFVHGKKNETQIKQSKVVLPILPVRIKTPFNDQYVETYALLDSGSNSTFCTNDLARRLKVTGKKSKIKLTTMGMTEEVETTVLQNLQVADIEGNNTICLPEVITRSVIPVTKEEIPTQDDIDEWPQFRDVFFLPRIESDVDLLIGLNVPEVLMPRQTISTEGGPYATKSSLGWTINGPLNGVPDAVSRLSFRAHADINTMCSSCADVIDAYSDNLVDNSEEDLRFLDAVSKSIRHHEDGHYEIALPLKNPLLKLPNNRILAERRAEYLKRKLLRDGKFKDDYVAFMNETIEQGHAVRVPEDRLNENDGRTWYIPHHGVYHKKKKDKIRVVFDCSSKYQGLSLNDALMQGPDLTSSLLGVLIRFRQEPFAFMADIKGMFHQVRVPELDRDLLRFLWWNNGETDGKLEEYQMTVHLFGAISSPSCVNFALRKNAEDTRGEFDEEVITTVYKNFYVDDCLKSVDTREKAVTLIKDLCRMMNKGGFRLNKWIASDRQVLQSIPEEERNKEVKDFDFVNGSLPVERALGVTWNVDSDTLGFKINVKDLPFTRRGMLSLVSSVYDPLGLAVPFTLSAKILLQELTRKRLGWDEEIPSEDLCRWKKWIAELPLLSNFSIGRCIKSQDLEDVASAQIHHFSDASQSAYGTVSYLRMTDSSGNVHCSFLFGKSRLAPLKQITIPRLELTAATLSVRSDKMLRKELEIPVESSTFWTDSMIVISYIENTTKKFQTFVSNRVAFIRDSTNASQWRYTDTANNPADDATRDLSVHAFLTRKRWLLGPEFLWKPQSEWPVRPNTTGDLDDDPEVKKETTSLSTVMKPSLSNSLDDIIQRFCSWFRLRRIIARCLKWKKHFKAKLTKKGEEMTDSTDCRRFKHFITVEELQEAEKEIIKYVQRKAYHDEVAALSCGKNIKRTSHLLKLDPIMVDNLIRVGGRLRNSSFPEDTKHQIIIPKNSHVAKLIITDLHIKSGHSGREYCLAMLRQRYWIVHANSTVRKVLSRCFQCKQQQSNLGKQKMADLPSARITPDHPPFTYTGVDYFGPFFVRVKRSMVKRYGVIFTCLTVRAIHIEVSHALDTDSFILALRRFTARRGQVKEMYSDNGTNFVGGERELREAIESWNAEQIHDHLLQKNIKWFFNTPTASHQGGSWERCIRTIRKILGALTTEQVLDDEGLATLMTEVEAIVNGRPLTKVSSDPNDLEPLTPNHLLLLDQQAVLPPGIFDKNDCYSRRRWRQIQYLADIFWKRWSKEYLPILQTREKWNFPKRNFAIDDIVLIADPSSPRNQWQIGRVTEVYPDKYGLVRRLKIKTKNGTFCRPVTKLCLLESAI